MATRLSCDGCEQDLAKHVHDDATKIPRDVCPRCKLGYEGIVVGRLDVVVYCDDCKAVWAAHEAREAGARVALIEAFEGWRAQAAKALHEGEAPPATPAFVDGSALKVRSFAAGEPVVMDEAPAAPRRRLALLPDEG